MSEKKEIRKKLLNQIEFYFSDSNILKDKFIKSQIDSNPDGYVDLSIIASFNK